LQDFKHNLCLKLWGISVSFFHSLIITYLSLSRVSTYGSIIHNVTSLYQFREDETANFIDKLDDFNFWNSDDYFWNNECFWFDKSMDWIIYLSHEQTITFGGEWLVIALKNKWTNWIDNISWDTKNR
jgi:hypothetical protein